MINLKDAVIDKPRFEKVASFELSTDVTEWSDEILKQFFEEISYLPKEFGVDTVINHVDENKGYAKGSIVVWYQGKQINFPVIVKDYQLSPFDVFIHKPENKPVKYYSASLDNVKKVLASEQIAAVDDKTRSYGSSTTGVKRPGDIIPKSSIDVNATPADMRWPPFSKISGWPFLARKEDLEKLGVQLKAQPNVGASFVDNTGDLVSNIVELDTKIEEENRVVADTHKEGDLDLNDVVQAKRAITVIDSQMIDTSKLVPMKAPCVCELRMYEYPSMEDFLESGSNLASRFLASKIGRPIVGVVLDYMDQYDLNSRNDGEACCPSPAQTTEADGTVEQKVIRNRRDQVFLSIDGKYYSKYSDYDKHGIGFYGSNMLAREDALPKAIARIAKNTTDNFINQNWDNRNDGSDKLFKPIKESQQGKGDGYDGPSYHDSWRTSMFILYGAGGAWECVKLRGNYKKYRVNDSSVYVSQDCAVIPANVATIQKVGSVEDPIYKMIIGKVKDIYLIPEGAKILNSEYMTELNRGDFMRPDKSVQKVYEDASIKKVALWIEGEGYRIEGEAFEPLQKIAGLNGQALSTKETMTALQVLGMEKDAATEAMKVAVDRHADGGRVTIYGVRGDYINPDVFKEREKQARIHGYWKQVAEGLRRDLVKEASALSDQEAVDVVLSLNFINENSLGNYIDGLSEMKKVAGKLAELLVASRMGLAEVEEGAVKKSMEGLNEVISGLEDVKMAVEE